MNRNDKDWTLVNDDGSFELDQSGISSIKTRSTMDSDSDQDFEVLAKPVNKCMTSQSLAKFKGIYIKEDHFAEGIDDGSDIEVIRMTDPVKMADEICDCGSTDSKDSIEFVDNNTLSAFPMVDSEFLNDIEEPIGEILSKETLDEVLNGKDDCTERNHTRTTVDSADIENEFEGLIELFKQDKGDKVDDCDDDRVGDEENDDVLCDIAALFDGHLGTYNETTASKCSLDTKFINDGILLSSSMFIILLCLSLSAGIFIGKGFSCLSQSYQTYQLQTENSVINMKEHEAPKSVQDNKRDDRFDLVNDASLQSLSSEAAKLRNETRETMTIRFAYQEMQLQYLRLEKKYRDLSQQYRAQKKIMFFSKKMQMINAQKQSENRNVSSTANQSVADKELLWWRMRTAVWRRKYLDLKVKFIDAEKELARGKANITFKACTGLLTRFIPELNVTSLLATNRIATGAKICWRKVVNPVKVVGERMGSGLYGLSRKVDGFWAVIKSKWTKDGKEKDRSVKMTSKWRNFRRMFRMSNIIGSFGSRKSGVKHERLKDKPYCEKNPVSFAKDRPEGWTRDDKIQERVTYPLPQSADDLDEANDSIVDGRREQREDEDDSFKPCSNNVGEDYHHSKVALNTGKRDLGEKEEIGNQFHMNPEIEVEKLREKLSQMEKYQDKRRGDLRIKQEILEKKMRHHSNKKRKERSMLKKREQKLKRKMKRVHEKLEKMFERKIKELKSKNKNIQNELKKGIEMNKKEKETLDTERAKFREKVVDIQEKLRNAEEELQRRRTNFDKWNEEMRTKIVRENAHGISKRYSEEKKFKRKHQKLVKKMKEKIERQKGKLEMKEKAISSKVEQLRSVLRRLMKEEKVKYEQMKKKDEELKSKENQVEMVKLFYEENLKREKEKHAEAKEMVWQMKQRVIKLKEIHDEILRKYKNVQQKLSLEREKLTVEGRKTAIYYPTVYCPDQNSCRGRTIVKGYAYTNVIEGSTPSVFCPSKDSCSGQGSTQKPDEFQTLLDKKRSRGIDSELMVLKRDTALHPVPPNSQFVKKVHPFFNLVGMNDNTTSRDQESKPNNVTPEPGERGNDKQDPNWYFSLMQERARQRGTPMSWYLYWSHGRSSWRNAPGKGNNDNWFLKTMQERERQRSMPVHWYFKRGKGREENQLNERASWYLNRGKGREEARKKEGFYYCW